MGSTVTQKAAVSSLHVAKSYVSTMSVVEMTRVTAGVARDQAIDLGAARWLTTKPPLDSEIRARRRVGL